MRQSEVFDTRTAPSTSPRHHSGFTAAGITNHGSDQEGDDESGEAEEGGDGGRREWSPLPRTSAENVEGAHASQTLEMMDVVAPAHSTPPSSIRASSSPPSPVAASPSLYRVPANVISESRPSTSASSSIPVLAARRSARYAAALDPSYP